VPIRKLDECLQEKQDAAAQIVFGENGQKEGIKVQRGEKTGGVPPLVLGEGRPAILK